MTATTELWLTDEDASTLEWLEAALEYAVEENQVRAEECLQEVLEDVLFEITLGADSSASN